MVSRSSAIAFFIRICAPMTYSYCSMSIGPSCVFPCASLSSELLSSSIVTDTSFDPLVSSVGFNVCWFFSDASLELPASSVDFDVCRFVGGAFVSFFGVVSFSFSSVSLDFFCFGAGGGGAFVWLSISFSLPWCSFSLFSVCFFPFGDLFPAPPLVLLFCHVIGRSIPPISP